MTLVTQPARRLPYASLLGWDRSLGELGAKLASPDPDLRILMGPHSRRAGRRPSRFFNKNSWRVG